MKFWLIIQIIGIKGIFRLLASISKHGFNLLSLLDFAKYSPTTEAYIQDDQSKLSYVDLYKQSIALANHLETEYKVKHKTKVAIISRNSVVMVKALFSVSSLGADMILLNPNQKKDYYKHVFDNNQIHLIVGENKQDFLDFDIPFFEEGEKIIYSALKNNSQRKSGTIIILSSGTKGKPKNEKRKLNTLKFLNPVIDIAQKTKLTENNSVLISVPIFHGYGLAALLLSIFLNKKIRLTRKFDVHETRQILEYENINCWIVVPLMIQKLYTAPYLKPNSLKSIISGGDVLPSKIVHIIQDTSNIEIFNMYGSSETGVCLIATNEDLKKYPNTIGKSILGVKMRINNAKGIAIYNQDIGELVVKCEWSSDDKKDEFYKTGDLFFKNQEGYYFYAGRMDDLIIIGGENIYPYEIEAITYKNSKTKWVKACGINSKNGNIGIHLDLLVHDKIKFNEDEFKSWLVEEFPKYMIPNSITLLDSEPTLKLM